MTRKVLWVVDANMDRFIAKATEIRADTVCIRTTNGWLKGNIGRIRRLGFNVYGWRWPAVLPGGKNHHYAKDEAAFACELIAEGLDGYIVDPESDAGRPVDDWNDTKHAPLAASFCDTILSAGRKASPTFRFGLTSGCRYPTGFKNIPWKEFVDRSDAVYPQAYWYAEGIGSINGGSPAKALDLAVKSWSSIVSSRVPIIPIVGEIEGARASELASYAEIAEKRSLSEIHFYVYQDNVSKENWEAVRSISPPPGS